VIRLYICIKNVYTDYSGNTQGILEQLNNGNRTIEYFRDDG